MNSIDLKINDEDENDLILYKQAMIEHEENPQDISFDEMLIQLGLDEEKND